MEEDINRAIPAKNRIKRVAFYAGLFLAGAVLASFAGEGIDAMKKTANLAAQTAGEAWAPNSNLKTIARVPLKSAETKPKEITVAKKSKSAQMPVVVAAPDVKKDANPQITPEIKVAAAATSAEIAAKSAANQSPAEEQGAPPAVSAPAVSNPSPVPAASSGSGRLVIAEVQISGAGGTENDFIKLGNPTQANLDVSGWKIRKRTKTGTESSIRVIPGGTVIGAGATILWANSKNNFAANMGAQIISSATISKDNSVAIFDSAGNLVDAAAWGGGTGQFTEGQPYPANPDDGQVLRRKIKDGTWVDTGNNSTDFLI